MPGGTGLFCEFQISNFESPVPLFSSLDARGSNP
jgi:hypothetical protein